MKKNVRFITHGALIAALYAAVNFLQNTLLPGSASQMIQFRAAEALCVLALFSPAAISGLTVGCLLFNITFAAALPLDWLVGTLATVLATSSMYLLRNVRFKGYPLPSLLMPALFNALLVGWELTVYIGGGFWLNAIYVALGELIVLLIFGTGLLHVLEKRNLANRLFRKH